VKAKEIILDYDGQGRDFSAWFGNFGDQPYILYERLPDKSCAQCDGWYSIGLFDFVGREYKLTTLRYRAIPYSEWSGRRSVCRSNSPSLSSCQSRSSTSPLNCPVSASWSQVGNSINGEAPWDRSGYSISLSADGKTVAIGAHKNDGINGNDTGHVRVYDWDGAQWSQRGTDIDGEAPNDWSGWSISLSKDATTVAIGAHYNDSHSGHVRIYKWIGNAWTQAGQDIDGKASDFAGWSVSLSGNGNRVAIGAPGVHAGDAIGRARIYDLGEGNVWSQLGDDIEGEGSRDRFGRSVSLSCDGNTVAIGASDNDGNGDNSGHVRVYDWNGNVWVQRGGDIDGEAAYDRSGHGISLSADGNTVAIGAYENDGTANVAGHVRIYDWYGNAWVQRGSDIDGQARGDYSGLFVSLSAEGNTVAIGAYENDGINGPGSGHARVYSWDGHANAWIRLGVDLDGEAPNDWSGWSVSLSADGTTVAVSAPQNDDNGSEAGNVRVFTISC
jgi:hypothetical protein